MLVNHISEESGRLVNVLVINLESNLRSDAGALTRSLVRNKTGKNWEKWEQNAGDFDLK